MRTTDKRFTEDGLPILTQETSYLIGRHIQSSHSNQSVRWLREIVNENPKMAECIALLSLTHSTPTEIKAASFDMIIIYQALKHQARQYNQEEELREEPEYSI